MYGALSGYEQLTSCRELGTCKLTLTFFTICLSFTGYQGNRIINCCFAHTNYTRKLIMTLAVCESLYLLSYKRPAPLPLSLSRKHVLELVHWIYCHAFCRTFKCSRLYRWEKTTTLFSIHVHTNTCVLSCCVGIMLFMLHLQTWSGYSAISAHSLCTGPQQK